MSQKTLGMILIAVGLIVLIVAGFADSLGIGVGRGFGWKQIVGSVAGVLVALVGFWLTRRKAA